MQRSSELRNKLLIKGTHLTAEKVREIARSFDAVDIQQVIVTNTEKALTSSNWVEKRKADAFVLTERVILVPIDVVQEETPSVRSAIR